MSRLAALAIRETLDGPEDAGGGPAWMGSLGERGLAPMEFGASATEDPAAAVASAGGQAVDKRSR